MVVVAGIVVVGAAVVGAPGGFPAPRGCPSLSQFGRGSFAPVVALPFPLALHTPSELRFLAVVLHTPSVTILRFGYLINSPG